MSAPSLPRALLITLPFALVLAGCNAGQGKPGVPPGLGDTNPAAGQAPRLESPCFGTVERCTAEQFAEAEPCKGEDGGSVCKPDSGTVIPWVGPDTAIPKISWTFPCTPDGFRVRLEVTGAGLDLVQGNWDVSTTQIAEDDLEAPVCSWQPEIESLAPGRRYTYYVTAVLVNASPYDERYGRGDFWVGPMCEGEVGIDNLPPRAVYPPDGGMFAPPQQVMDNYPDKISWTYFFDMLSECLIRFEGEVSTDKTFATGVMPIVTSGPMSQTGVVAGTVQWCHTYHWRVRALNDDAQGPWSEVSSFRIAPPGGWDKCNEFPRQGSPFEAVATKNAACRIGPGTGYGIAGYVAAGESHPVDGRNAEGTWFRFQDLKCYVSGALLQHVQNGTPIPGGADVGDLMSAIPIVPDPPLPTETTAASGPSGPVCSPTLPRAECLANGWPYSDLAGRCVCP